MPPNTRLKKNRVGERASAIAINLGRILVIGRRRRGVSPGRAAAHKAGLPADSSQGKERPVESQSENADATIAHGRNADRRNRSPRRGRSPRKHGEASAVARLLAPGQNQPQRKQERRPNRLRESSFFHGFRNLPAGRRRFSGSPVFGGPGPERRPSYIIGALGAKIKERARLAGPRFLALHFPRKRLY